MKISEEFPSKYLKASDLKGQEVRVTMSNVEKEKMGEDTKLALYFKGKEKAMILNKTNSTTISDFYGDDTADWYDQPVILFSVMTEYQGKATPGLRVRIPTARDRAPPRREDPISTSPKRMTEGVSGSLPQNDLDDSIPFAPEYR